MGFAAFQRGSESVSSSNEAAAGARCGSILIVAASPCSRTSVSSTPSSLSSMRHARPRRRTEKASEGRDGGLHLPTPSRPIRQRTLTAARKRPGTLTPPPAPCNPRSSSALIRIVRQSCRSTSMKMRWTSGNGMARSTSGLGASAFGTPAAMASTNFVTKRRGQIWQAERSREPTTTSGAGGGRGTTTRREWEGAKSGRGEGRGETMVRGEDNGKGREASGRWPAGADSSAAEN